MDMAMDLVKKRTGWQFTIYYDRVVGDGSELCAMDLRF
jgi:hypothetical protein